MPLLICQPVDGGKLPPVLLAYKILSPIIARCQSLPYLIKKAAKGKKGEGRRKRRLSSGEKGKTLLC